MKVTIQLHQLIQILEHLAMSEGVGVGKSEEDMLKSRIVIKPQVSAAGEDVLVAWLEDRPAEPFVLEHELNIDTVNALLDGELQRDARWSFDDKELDNVVIKLQDSVSDGSAQLELFPETISWTLPEDQQSFIDALQEYDSASRV